VEFDPDAFMQQLQSMQQQNIADVSKHAALAAKRAAQEVLQEQAKVQKTSNMPVSHHVHELPPPESGVGNGGWGYVGSSVGSGGGSSSNSMSSLPAAAPSAASSISKQLLELQAQQAYDDSVMQQRAANRNAQIERLQFLMRNQQ
jgi:hypothetical protein